MKNKKTKIDDDKTEPTFFYKSYDSLTMNKITNDNREESLDTLRRVCKFEDENDVYILYAIARKRYNPLTNAQEIVFREVIKDDRDIMRKYRRIMGLINEYSEYNFYVYITLNARDTVKGLFSMQNEINNWIKDYFNNVDICRKLKRVNNYWMSNIMKPHSRARRGKFMIDIDTLEPVLVQNILKVLNTYANVLFMTHTRNGYHVITKPFDVKKFSEELIQYNHLFEIKKDALVFVGFKEAEKK